MSNVTKFNLNLSVRYVPNWGPKEVAREIISNGFDADPDGMTIKAHGINSLLVKTNTVPSIGHLMVIGSGTKTEEDSNIGQFGEGFKLAALVTTRLNGKLMVTFENKTIEFSIEDYLGDKVLFATIRELPKTVEGMTVHIVLPGVGKYAGMFLQDRSNRVWADNEAKVYVKGVEVRDAPFNYSICTDEIRLNRDRNFIESVYLYPLYVKYASHQFKTKEQWKTFINCIGIGTVVYLMAYQLHGLQHANPDSLKLFVEELANLGHEYVVVAQNDVASRNYAAQLGKVVLDPPTRIRKCFPEFSFNEEIGKDSKEEADDVLLFARELTGCQELNYAVMADAQLGMADFSTNKAFVNRNLKGNPKAVLGTAMHEVAHLRSRSADGTRAFEEELTKMLGELAYMLFIQGDL